MLRRVCRRGRVSVEWRWMGEVGRRLGGYVSLDGKLGAGWKGIY